MIQHGGLPLIKQTNFSFPDNFLVEAMPNLRFSLMPGVLFSFTIPYPLSGTWFVVAYHQDVNKEIRQKVEDKDENLSLHLVSVF